MSDNLTEVVRHKISRRVRRIALLSDNYYTVTFCFNKYTVAERLIKPGLNVLCLCNISTARSERKLILSRNANIFCNSAEQITIRYACPNKKALLIVIKTEENTMRSTKDLSTIRWITRLWSWPYDDSHEKYPQPIRDLYKYRQTINVKISMLRMHADSQGPFTKWILKQSREQTCLRSCF
jgi:hypothetical protein